MAQSKSFFTHRHGSTKSHTYATNAGQQITKDRVDETTNQRTDAQMAHRCLIHTMSDAHAWLRKYFTPFWENESSPTAALKAFRKANYSILANAAISGNKAFMFSPYKENTKPFGLYKVTNGSFTDTVFINNFQYPRQTRLLIDWEANGLKQIPLSSWANQHNINIGTEVYFCAWLWNNSAQSFKELLVKVRFTSIPNTAYKYLQPQTYLNMTVIKNDAGVTPSLVNGYLCALEVSQGSSGSDVHKAYVATWIVTKRNNKQIVMPAYLAQPDPFDVEPTYQQAIETYPTTRERFPDVDIPLPPEMVDLKLPSKTIWRTMNLGANAPEEAGLYFSWGNVDGHSADSGYNFSESVYNNTPGKNLNVDIPVSAANDAVVNILGNGWRMPTEDDLKELKANTDLSFTTIQGVYGALFTSKLDTSKSIFIPLAGMFEDSSLIEVNEYAELWSSTLKGPTKSQGFWIGDNSCGTYSIARKSGLTIRPVYSRT